MNQQCRTKTAAIDVSMHLNEMLTELNAAFDRVPIAYTVELRRQRYVDIFGVLALFLQRLGYLHYSQELHRFALEFGDACNGVKTPLLTFGRRTRAKSSEELAAQATMGWAADTLMKLGKRSDEAANLVVAAATEKGIDALIHKYTPRAESSKTPRTSPAPRAINRRSAAVLEWRNRGLQRDFPSQFAQDLFDESVSLVNDMLATQHCCLLHPS